MDAALQRFSNLWQPAITTALSSAAGVPQSSIRLLSSSAQPSAAASTSAAGNAPHGARRLAQQAAAAQPPPLLLQATFSIPSPAVESAVLALVLPGTLLAAGVPLLPGSLTLGPLPSYGSTRASPQLQAAAAEPATRINTVAVVAGAVAAVLLVGAACGLAAFTWQRHSRHTGSSRSRRSGGALPAGKQVAYPPALSFKGRSNASSTLYSLHAPLKLAGLWAFKRPAAADVAAPAARRRSTLSTPALRCSSPVAAPPAAPAACALPPVQPPAPAQLLSLHQQLQRVRAKAAWAAQQAGSGVATAAGAAAAWWARRGAGGGAGTDDTNLPVSASQLVVLAAGSQPHSHSFVPLAMPPRAQQGWGTAAPTVVNPMHANPMAPPSEASEVSLCSLPSTPSSKPPASPLSTGTASLVGLAASPRPMPSQLSSSMHSVRAVPCAVPLYAPPTTFFGPGGSPGHLSVAAAAPAAAARRTPSGSGDSGTQGSNKAALERRALRAHFWGQFAAADTRAKAAAAAAQAQPGSPAGSSSSACTSWSGSDVSVALAGGNEE